MPKGNGHSIYEFNEFMLDASNLMLYRGGAEISLPPKVIKTLAVLVENRGEILSKEELIDKVWEDSIVEESNLSQYLYLLRKTLGSKADGSPYIETLRRRGYRFTGQSTLLEPSPAVANGDNKKEEAPKVPGMASSGGEMCSRWLIGRQRASSKRRRKRPTRQKP